MGGVLCGASDPTGRVGALGALDEAYGRPPKAKKGEEPAESFVERLCKRIAETDVEYKDEFEESEPKAEPTSLGVTHFKRWATKTARCNPLWRVAEAEIDRPLTLEDFQAALSTDGQFQFTGYILMAKKLTDGDGELLQPHSKSRKHWLPWEENKTKDYFWEILRAAGKENASPKSLDFSDIRTFCESDGILLRHIEYCFGFTEWSAAQKSLATKNKEPYVTVSLNDAQMGFDGKGNYINLGILLQAYQRAVALPGKNKDEVKRGDRYYFDQKPNDGSSSGNDGGDASRENSAYPALGHDDGPKESSQPAAASEDKGGHLVAPSASAANASSDKPSEKSVSEAPDAEPSRSASFYPQLGKK